MMHTPYNFIPFSDKVIRRYENMDMLPPHNKIDTSLKTGEIRVSVTAKTPIFISNGEKEADFFRGTTGQYEIPGSTIRGLVRENVHILGFGLVRPQDDIEDYQIFFRDMTSSKESIAKEIKDYYRNCMDIMTTRVGNKTVATPRNVKYGYITNDKEKYTIRPTKEPIARVKRSMVQQYMFRGKELENAVMYPVEYKVNEKDCVTWISHCTSNGSMNKRGVLLITGRPVGRNKNCCYVFPQEDTEANEKEILECDILSYKMDYERRRTTLHDSNDFWKLPRDGETKPIFYIEHDNHVYFGMSLFLRIGYPNSLMDGLPEQHKSLIESQNDTKDTLFMDYVYSMFGFANKQTSYKSRVSFENFSIVDNKRTTDEKQLILLGPKPSYYQGYVCDGKNYVSDDFQLRGYKQYWMKDISDSVMEVKNSNVAKRLRPLPVGTKFEGTIRYKNLQEDELGLLLWAIQLEAGCFQSIGMGKPYGYGCVKVTIDGISNYDFKQLYQAQSLQGDQVIFQKDSIDSYIQSYKDYAARKLSTDESTLKVDDVPEIKDFFYLHKTFNASNINMDYMTLDEYKEEKKNLVVLPTIEEYREGKTPRRISRNSEQRNKQKDSHNERRDKEAKNQPKNPSIMVGGLDFSRLSKNMNINTRNKDKKRKSK